MLTSGWGGNPHPNSGFNQEIFWLVVSNIFYFPYIGNNHRNWLIFGHGLLLGWARRARRARQAGPVGPVGARRTRWGPTGPLGPLGPTTIWGSRAVLLYEVLGRRSCRDPVDILEDSWFCRSPCDGYPSEILCCRGVCEEILRTSCWNPLKDICAKI